MSVNKEVIDQQIKALGEFDNFGTKKEISYLPEVLTEGELIKGLTSGFCNNNTWLIVVTNRRLLFLDKGLLYSLKQFEYTYDQISAVGHSTGMFLGEIRVATSGDTCVIKSIAKSEVPKIAQLISDLVKQSREKPSSASNSDTDVVSQLEKLAALREKGLLTDAEFKMQKEKLLNS